MRDYHRRLLAAAEAAGISHPTIEHTGQRHPRLTGKFAGKPFRLVIACSPHQCGASLPNAIARLRRRVRDLSAATSPQTLPRLTPTGDHRDDHERP